MLTDVKVTPHNHIMLRERMDTIHTEDAMKLKKLTTPRDVGPFDDGDAPEISDAEHAANLLFLRKAQATADQRETIITPAIQNLIDQGAVFYVSHSGGKDSQAMYSILSQAIPADQIVVVHADLGEIEHDGVQDHIRANVNHEVHVVRAAKTFFEMVERRFENRPEVASWPSAQYRQCTSDLKRDPIHKFIRQDLKAKGLLLAVNCIGIRAEESVARSKKSPFKLNTRLSLEGGRQVHEWFPIFDLTINQVWDVIRSADQTPHPIYREGNERLSCVVCIMGSRNDIQNAARLRPELFKKYTDLETRTGWTMFQGQTLLQKAGLQVETVELTSTRVGG